MKIAIQGIEGSFHHIAVDNLFGDAVYQLVPCDSFLTLTQYVNQTPNGIGVMAIENSIAGSLLGNYKLIQEFGLKIIAEVYLRIRHQLLALPGTNIEELTEVHSHPMALNQCRDFLLRNKGLKRVEKMDTAQSAQDLKQNKRKYIGAIAGKLAAKLNGLDIIVPNIESDEHNYTRFLVVERRENASKIVKEANKLTISFELDNNIGALHSILNYLAKNNINMTKIESSPIIGKTWQYMFFVDLILPKDINLDKILKGLMDLGKNVVVLGQYEKGVYYDD